MYVSYHFGFNPSQVFYKHKLQIFDNPEFGEGFNPSQVFYKPGNVNVSDDSTNEFQSLIGIL